MAVLSSNANFDFAPQLLQKIISEAEDELGAIFGTSPLTSPSSSHSPSRCSSPSPTSTPDLPCSTSHDPCPELLSPPSEDRVPASLNTSASKSRDRKTKHKASKRSARREKRAKAAQTSFGIYQVCERVLQRYVNDSPTVPSSFATEKSKVDQKGFVAINTRKSIHKVHSLAELLAEVENPFRLYEWDGKTPTSITDSTNRVVGILAGTPDDKDWPQMYQEAAEALETRRGRCSVSKKQKQQQLCRGSFVALQCGVSHGGGQTRPKNLYNVAKNKLVLEELNALRPFKRIAGFASSVMASHAPHLYGYYAETLGKLFKHDPSLRKNFPSTIFPAATYNLGPQTLCYTHTDPGNFACGLCSVTPFGDFDYTKGGHLVLWDFRLIIQFPPGSTILLPSSIVAHSNTAIAAHETRHSFALYSAGALFRWVENGFQTSVNFYSSLSPEQKKSVEALNTARWKSYLSLLPVIERKKENVL